MAELKQAERMKKVRDDVRNAINLPDNAVQVGTDAYVTKTELGYGKIVISAIKDINFNAEEAREEYEMDLQIAKGKADKRKAEAEAKKAANLAKKAAAKAAKEAKEA